MVELQLLYSCASCFLNAVTLPAPFTLLYVCLYIYRYTQTHAYQRISQLFKEGKLISFHMLLHSVLFVSLEGISNEIPSQIEAEVHGQLSPCRSVSSSCRLQGEKVSIFLVDLNRKNRKILQVRNFGFCSRFWEEPIQAPSQLLTQLWSVQLLVTLAFPSYPPSFSPF